MQRIFLLLIVIIFFTDCKNPNLPAETLELGKPFQLVIKNSVPSYYSLPSIPPLSQDNKLIFLFTPTYGDADLYVSSSLDVIPSKEKHYWKATCSGGGKVEIDKYDKNYSTGPYYLALYALQPQVEGTLVAYIQNSDSDGNLDHVILLDGIPQYGTLQDTVMYFKFYHQKENDVIISVTPLRGHPQVFVSIDETKPSLQKHTWKNLESNTEVIHIKKSDAQFKSKAWYYVAVRAEKFSQFYIVAYDISSQVQLPEGTPLRVRVDPSIPALFKFSVAKKEDLYFSIIDKPNSGLNMFVSTFYKIPSITNKEYHSSEGFLFVNKRDRMFRDQPHNVAIYSNTPLTFSLLAVTENGHITLAPGQIIESTIVAAGDHRWYRHFYMEGVNDTLGISITAPTGAIEAYAAKAVPYPCLSSHERRGTVYSGATIIHYNQIIDQTNYFIGVSSASNLFNYSIVAASTSEVIPLKNGISVIRGISYDEYSDFSFVVPDPKYQITITNHGLTGSSELLASVKPQPRIGSADWTASRVLNIIPNDPRRVKSGPQTLYISVRGKTWNTIFFKITAIFTTERA